MERIVSTAKGYGVYIGTVDQGQLFMPNQASEAHAPDSHLRYCLDILQVHVVREGDSSVLFAPLHADQPEYALARSADSAFKIR